MTPHNVKTISKIMVRATLSFRKLFPKYDKYFLVLFMVESMRSILWLMRRIYSFCFSKFVRLSSARSIVCFTLC